LLPHRKQSLLKREQGGQGLAQEDGDNIKAGQERRLFDSTACSAGGKAAQPKRPRPLVDEILVITVCQPHAEFCQRMAVARSVDQQRLQNTLSGRGLHTLGGQCCRKNQAEQDAHVSPDTHRDVPV
jgi:hypothetical protein